MSTPERDRPPRPSPATDAQVWPLVRDFAVSYRARTEQIFERSFADLLARPDTLVLVAEEGGSILGYLLASWHGTLFADGPVAWVEELMVAPSVRRSGVGRSLIASAERWERSIPCAYLALASAACRPLLRALGYDASATFYRRPFSLAVGSRLRRRHAHLWSGRKPNRSAVIRRGVVLVEQSSQPSGTRHARPECSRTLAQLAIDGDQRHVVIGVGVGGDEYVVAAAGCVHDRDAVLLTRLGAVTRSSPRGPRPRVGRAVPPAPWRGSARERRGLRRHDPATSRRDGTRSRCRVDEQHVRSLPERAIRPHRSPRPGAARQVRERRRGSVVQAGADRPRALPRREDGGVDLEVVDPRIVHRPFPK